MIFCNIKGIYAFQKLKAYMTGIFKRDIYADMGSDGITDIAKCIHKIMFTLFLQSFR